MIPQKSKKKIKVFVDYTCEGLWGVWFNTMQKLPNVLNPCPEEACITAAELLKAEGKEFEFYFSDAVVLWHKVKALTV